MASKVLWAEGVIRIMGGSSKRRKRLDSESYLLFRLKLNTISSKVIVLGIKLGKKWGG